MRNTIKILDNDKQKPNFSNIEVGSMFRYPSGAGDNVYMKVNHVLTGNSCILLSTGAIYTDFSRTNEIEVVTMVQISR